MFSYEFYEICKNMFFIEHLQATASKFIVEISEKFKIHFMWVKDLKCFKEDFKGNLMLYQAGSGGAFLTPAYFDPK